MLFVYFTFILLEVGQQRPLQIKLLTDPEELLLLLYHTPNTFCSASQIKYRDHNTQYNHHSDKTVLQEWVTHCWSNH